MQLINQKWKVLAEETGDPCVTISLNTHRTHPDSEQDKIVLRNLVTEAETRVLKEYGKREVRALLEKLATIESGIDANYNLDSLHIFLSNETQEVVRSAWPVNGNAVHLSDKFAVRPLLKDVGRMEEYYILLLSQGGVHLFEAVNDAVSGEVKNEDFPFTANRHYITHSDKASDPKQVDNMLREYLNKVDKALVKAYRQTGRQCIVLTTTDNYAHLMYVADEPAVYIGHVPIDYNRVSPHEVATQAWELMSKVQQDRRGEAISEMLEAVGQGKVITDLQEIYQAAIDGRGDLLIVNQDFSQPVLFSGERNFDIITDNELPGAVDDVVNLIAWEVWRRNGRVEFTRQEQLEKLDKIALKVRY